MTHDWEGPNTSYALRLRYWKRRSGVCWASDVRGKAPLTARAAHSTAHPGLGEHRSTADHLRFLAGRSSGSASAHDASGTRHIGGSGIVVVGLVVVRSRLSLRLTIGYQRWVVSSRLHTCPCS